MKILELFSGTGSVGKIAKEKGWEVTSLDLSNADININILEWNYREYKKDNFDIIWASPPCRTFSSLRRSHIGRSYANGNCYTKESIENDMMKIGIPLLRKTEEIIDYFNPTYYFIENPQTGKMKDFVDKPKFIVDYCMYSNYGYRKRTIIFSNIIGWNPRPLCKQNCQNCVNGKHLINFGITKKITHIGKWTSLRERYRIPPDLLREIFTLLK